MEVSHSQSSCSQLLCLEEIETRLDEEEELDDDDAFVNSSSNFASKTEEEEYFLLLRNREINVRLVNRQSSIVAGDKWIECARLDTIAWILKTRASFRFRFQTAYLSMTYFDRFLSARAIDREKYWAIRLLSVACLSLAAKMEECRVPALSKFQTEEHNFETKVIQRMELLVLNTLEWKMNSVTPFAYIHYFIRKFCCQDNSPPAKNLVSGTVEVILALMRDANLMDHRPSVIAGAASLVAIDRKLTRQDLEIKINSFSPNGFFQIEEIFSCYNRMQALEMEKVRTLPKAIISPPLSPFQLGGIDGFENSSSTSTICTKRKRLTFDDCDQNYGILNEKRDP